MLSQLAAALAERYRIERELGHGGMATVYLAHDLIHDRKDAIKVMKPELAAALGADRFLREIQITAQLQHPNILTLIDSGAMTESPGPTSTPTATPSNSAPASSMGSSSSEPTATSPRRSSPRASTSGTSASCC